jgi:hypothetical protein
MISIKFSNHRFKTGRVRLVLAAFSVLETQADLLLAHLPRGYILTDTHLFNSHRNILVLLPLLEMIHGITVTDY